MFNSQLDVTERTAQSWGRCKPTGCECKDGEKHCTKQNDGPDDTSKAPNRRREDRVLSLRFDQRASDIQESVVAALSPLATPFGISCSAPNTYNTLLTQQG